MAAIAMTVGISVMIHAFRRTVEVWIDRAIVADIFMTPAANETLGNGAFFPPDVLAASAPRAGHPRGGHCARDRHEHPRRPRFDGGRGRRRPGPARLRRRPRRGKTGGVLPAGHVLVSEPFEHRYHVAAGDRLPIPTPDGEVSSRSPAFITTIPATPASWRSAGENFIRHWHDERVMSAAVYLKNRRGRRRGGRPIRHGSTSTGNF